ncbi:MAG: helix-turn-helix domain-containing protein [Verrucomicrobiota bacterium]
MSNPVPEPPNRRAVLSTQVSGSRYFFLGLTGTSRAGVIPAYGGFERCDPDYVVQRRNFHFCSVELVVAGEGTVRFTGAEHRLHAGSLFCYGHGTQAEIRTDPARPMAKYFLCLTGARARARVRAAGLRGGTVQQLAMFTEVQRLWDDLIREGGHHRPKAARLCAALTEVLLLKIEELAGLPVSPGRAAEEAFLRCKGLIEAQAAQLGTLADITRATGVGPTRLNRLFRRYQGLSPYRYLLHRKMTLAAETLMNPGTLVKEAAAQVGFADPYHFSRCFKQVHRVAPKDFQRSLRHP